MDNYHDFQKAIGYNFKDIELLKLAFTHSSYSNEKKKGKLFNNERLEFLGDAVLELAISDFIFKEFTEFPEGELTKLRASVVCEPTLAANARKLKLGDFLLLGKGEDMTGGYDRDSILADCFEAVIGAIYLDGGNQAASEYIINILIDDINNYKNNVKSFDNKTHLQELVQRNSREAVEYVIVSETGPDHDKIFDAIVKHEGITIGRGSGKSKKEAEQNAANVALKKYNRR